jgi:ELWxxDGT repeat protein
MRTDGTVAGTAVVAPLHRPQQAVVGADAIYLVDFDAAGGNELWRSDGTAAGTARVVDLAPGREQGVLRLSRCGSNRVFLAATDGVTGLEPWISDGTAAGTVRLIDGNPNGNGNPTFLGVAGDRCYFLLDDGVHGIEPWQAPVGATGAAVVQSLGRGCAGAVGVPQLRANGLPVAGASTFGVGLDRVPANSLCVCLFGLQLAPTVLPSGCTVWPAGATATLFTGAGIGGEASFPLAIPATSALVGVQLAAQAGALDAFGTAVPGISLSNALILVVGG